MATRVILVSTVYLCFLFSLVSSDGDDNLAILHATSGSSSGDYCVGYDWQWKRIPDTLEEAPALVVATANPPMLCQSADNKSSLQDKAVGIMRGNCSFYTKGIHAQNAGAQEVIIITSDHLFVPTSNDSKEYEDIRIPMAVILHDDWTNLMGLGETVKVQLFSPKKSLFDYNLILILVLAVFTVVAGAYWSGVSRLYTPLVSSEENETQDHPPRDQEIEITPVMVIIFVIMICASLLLMYFFYKYLVYIVIALFALASCNGLFECLSPLLSRVPFGDCKVPSNKIPVLKDRPEIRFIFLLLFCLSMSIWWVIARHESYSWVLQDLLGMAFCISLIKNIRLSSLKICALLLLLLLVYDVFFVFITPLFSAKESIMVKVATGDGNKEQIPMVLRIPKLTLSTYSVCDRSYSLLGFGDILVPGLYVAYCHWFDIMMRTPRKIYFISVSISYGAGLIVTFVALYLMKTGQPALVYLVPFTLTTGTVIALVRKEFKEFWTGKMDVESQETNVEAPEPGNVRDDSEDDVILDRTQDSPCEETKRLLCR